MTKKNVQGIIFKQVAIYLIFPTNYAFQIDGPRMAHTQSLL
jgi:hypothetical protein